MVSFDCKDKKTFEDTLFMTMASCLACSTTHGTTCENPALPREVRIRAATARTDGGALPKNVATPKTIRFQA